MKKIMVLLLLFIYSNLFAYENENKVVCAITSKIAKFTQKNNSQMNPYTITLLHNKYGNLFTDLFKNIKIDNKNVQILYINNIRNLKRSNILFIFDTSPNALHRTLTYIKNRHILTISTMRGFAQRGGMVEIYAHNQKLKLKINIESLKQEGIYINSAVLRLATIVKGGQDDK